MINNSSSLGSSYNGTMSSTDSSGLIWSYILGGLSSIYVTIPSSYQIKDKNTYKPNRSSNRLSKYGTHTNKTTATIWDSESDATNNGTLNTIKYITVYSY